jgi:hypothetical protein
MALTYADIEEWARQAVADAPPLTPGRREQLRALLTACASAQSAAAVVVPLEPTAPEDHRQWNRKAAS